MRAPRCAITLDSRVPRIRFSRPRAEWTWVESSGRGLGAPLPPAGEVGATRRVRVLSSWGFSIAEIPSPQPSRASGEREHLTAAAFEPGRFDAINTGLFWTEERSKMLYLVPYAQQAISIYTDPASSLKLEKFEDLAGRVVGMESATYTERKAREFSAAMEAKGLKPIELRTFTTVTATSAALRAGQLEAALNINETANSLEQKGIAKIWVRDIAGTDITFAFRDKLLAQAFADALTAARADGTYDKLFDKFGMTKLKTTTFAIRGDGPTN
ncbi:transporter substrate-binding domain-containing protein [Bradyrhizobium sp. 1]|uniref:transporter substrate-binding domain-containing protein n=1 Tax=Bradyrhizobium sp. 1 TaxID=241591 RepID=UPI001FFA6A91|nr:transporter substrate-binding domain-containing protein [Bradyrhizobium sp. 1]